MVEECVQRAAVDLEGIKRKITGCRHFQSQDRPAFGIRGIWRPRGRPIHGRQHFDRWDRLAAANRNAGNCPLHHIGVQKMDAQRFLVFTGNLNEVNAVEPFIGRGIEQLLQAVFGLHLRTPELQSVCWYGFQ